MSRLAELWGIDLDGDEDMSDLIERLRNFTVDMGDHLAHPSVCRQACDALGQALADRDRQKKSREHWIKQAGKMEARIDELEKTNGAMESVLSLIGKHLNVEPGNVPDLLDAVGSLTAGDTRPVAKLCSCAGDCEGHFNCRIVWNKDAIERETNLRHPESVEDSSNG